MKTPRNRVALGLVATAILVASSEAAENDLANVPMQRLAVDDMENVSDWYNGSPDETQLAASNRHRRQGQFALEFANTVDHTRGEKNYPIGWPRSGKDLKGRGLTNWSDYEYFECWIYATTSRESLPKTPVGVGFYHSGPKRSTHFPLTEVRKDEWTKIKIPITKIEPADDIQRIQFNISESDYAHGDQVTFYIDDIVLARFAHPVIGAVNPRSRILYAGERQVTADFDLLGAHSGKHVNVVVEVGCDDATFAKASGDASDLHGEITATLDPARPLTPGYAWLKLTLVDELGKPLHARQADFRVIEGPF